MNKFDIQFFEKYVPEGQELVEIIHTHPIVILGKVFTKLLLLVFLPCFFYYFSETIQSFIPFIFFEIYIIILFIKIIYDIFNWYNDVWIISTGGVIWLERALFKTNTDSIEFDNIEGLGVEQDGILDKILRKGDLVINKIGEDSFILEDAVTPFRAVDIIETASKLSNELPGREYDERFDLIMDSLGSVVENFLEKETKEETEKKKKDKLLKKYKNKDETIDLS